MPLYTFALHDFICFLSCTPHLTMSSAPMCQTKSYPAYTPNPPALAVHCTKRVERELTPVAALTVCHLRIVPGHRLFNVYGRLPSACCPPPPPPAMWPCLRFYALCQEARPLMALHASKLKKQVQTWTRTKHGRYQQAYRQLIASQAAVREARIRTRARARARAGARARARAKARARA